MHLKFGKFSFFALTCPTQNLAPNICIWYSEYQGAIVAQKMPKKISSTTIQKNIICIFFNKSFKKFSTASGRRTNFYVWPMASICSCTHSQKHANFLVYTMARCKNCYLRSVSQQEERRIRGLIRAHFVGCSVCWLFVIRHRRTSQMNRSIEHKVQKWAEFSKGHILASETNKIFSILQHFRKMKAFKCS